MKKQIGIMMECATLLFLCACSHIQSPPTMTAKYTVTEPDPALAGDAWKDVPEYRLQPFTAGAWYDEIECANSMRKRVLEEGSVKLLWSEKYLYVGVRMTDSDLVDEAKHDQTHIFTQADTVELFLKPKKHLHYWEIYGSASGKKTCYFFPGRGRLGLPGNNEYHHGVTAQTTLHGTLNNWQDRDNSWTLLLKVPVADLTRHGAKWNGTEKWTIHLVRHNYSVHLPSKEVSVYPEFKANNPHFYEGYAELIFEK